MADKISSKRNNLPNINESILKQGVKLLASDYANSIDIIAAIDINQQFVFANNSLLNAFQYTIEEVRQRKFADLFQSIKTDVDINKILSQADKSLWSGEVICFKNDENTFNSRLKIISVQNNNGSLCGYALIAKNFEIIKPNYEKLFEFLLGLEKSYHYFPDIIIIFDENGDISKFKYFTIGSDYFVLRTEICSKLEEVFPQNIVEEIYLVVDKIKASPKTIYYEFSISINRNEKIFAARITNISKNQYSINLRDITTMKLATRELKKTKEELSRVEKLAAIGKMSTFLSHEIKNPVSSLKYYINVLLKNQEMPEDTKPILNLLHDSLGNLSKLLNNVLLFSSNIKLIKIDINIYDLVEKVCELLNHKISKKNIQFRNNLGITVIRGDYVSLQSVFFNLIENAADAVSEGGVIEINDSVNDGNYLIRITDNGEGIVETAKIFEAFHSGKKGGTGLGLAIAKKIMDLHEGNINLLETKPGKTTFELQFPS